MYVLHFTACTNMNGKLHGLNYVSADDD